MSDSDKREAGSGKGLELSKPAGSATSHASAGGNLNPEETGRMKAREVLTAEKIAEAREEKITKPTTRARRFFLVLGEIGNITTQILNKTKDLIGGSIAPIIISILGFFIFIFTRLQSYYINKNKKAHIKRMRAEANLHAETLRQPEVAEMVTVDLPTGYWNQFGTKGFEKTAFAILLLLQLASNILDAISIGPGYLAWISLAATILYVIVSGITNHIDSRNLAKQTKLHTRRITILKMLSVAPPEQRMGMVKTFTEQEDPRRSFPPDLETGLELRRAEKRPPTGSRARESSSPQAESKPPSPQSPSERHSFLGTPAAANPANASLSNRPLATNPPPETGPEAQHTTFHHD